MDALTKKKTDRFRFLNRLYERTDGDYLALEDMWEVGADVGLTSEETERVMDYLNGEGLAMHRAIGGAVAITHAGLREVESALSVPEAPTHYFPAVVNVLQVQSMVGSQIQQGSHGSTQTQSQTITQNELTAIQTLVAALQAELEAIGLGADAKAEAEAELQTLKAQLQSSKPKSTIIRESLKTLRNLVEGVASNAVAAGILPLFAPLTALLGF
jgi:hypothetical protein